MDVYLMRHAHAVERDEWNEPDADRPLTAKGRKAAEVVAGGLARMKTPISQIVSSPYARALETARIVGERLGVAVAVNDRLAPGFDRTGLINIVASARFAGGLLLVGHEPDLGDLLRGITGASQPIALKKAAVALLRLPQAAVGAATPGWHAYAEITEGATLVWLRAWREWDGRQREPDR